MCTFTERIWSFFNGRNVDHQSNADSATGNSLISRIFLAAHPCLLAVAPIVHLYSQNLYEADFGTMLIFAGGALALTALMYAVAWLCLRDSLKAALVVTAFNVLFYAYGWVYDFLMNHEPIRLPYMTWHWVLIIFSYTIVLTLAALLHYSRRDLRTVSRFLSGTLAIWLAMCVVKIVYDDVQMLRAARKRVAVTAHFVPPSDYPRVPPLNVDSPKTPDVYYIILDGYARADTLKRVCHFDNSGFLDFLRSRGFYVADESCSNFPFTDLSITSSMNMSYLEEALPPQCESQNQSRVFALLANALVPRVFQSKGYRYIVFANLFQSDPPLADIVFRLRPDWLLSGFSKALFRTTALRMFEPSIAAEHLYELENLKRVPHIDGPTFTLCHIVAPHSPYVFDEFGNVRENVPQSMLEKDCAERHPLNEEMKQAYVNQIKYLNRRIEEDVDYLLKESPVPPVIIIQGDHGSWFTLPAEINDASLAEFAKERMTILNAYYVPEAMRGQLTPRTTPVNSFRLLFDFCFGEHFPLLVEKNLVGWYGDKFNLENVAQVLRPASETDSAMARKAIAPPLATPR
jgi:hypothetical protein